jgi:hypothetical protein
VFETVESMNVRFAVVGSIFVINVCSQQ